MALQITEIFYSIQGESTYSGLRCVFVRLTGCNLRCRWCDTEYAFHGGQRMERTEVHAAIARFPARLVEITGGEPMLQAAEVTALAMELLASGYTVLLETSGERDLAGLPAGVVKVMDVKCPGSGEAGRLHLPNLQLLGARDQLKFVLSDRGDYDFACDFLRQHDLGAQGPEVLFSPAFRTEAQGARSSEQCALDPRELAEWMLADAVPARLSFQAHKFIWDPALHGV